MPFNNGGDYTHLQEHNRQDKGANFAAFSDLVRAQSFTPSVDFHLYAVSLRLLKLGMPGVIVVSINECDDDDKPITPAIDWQVVDTLLYSEWAPKWYVFYFKTLPLLTAGVRYAIVLRVWGGNWLNMMLWRGAMFGDFYSDGEEMYSPDNGESWAKQWNYDACFRTWGFEPPAPLPPVPVISNWAGKEIKYERTSDGLKVIFTTDTYCHLWKRETKVPPEIHSKPALRRGLMMHEDLRFCFVAYHEVEQVEEGDTLLHTFIQEPWPVCETRWFYMLGSRVDVRQPSTSPVLKKHRTALETLTLRLTGNGDEISIPEPPDPLTHWQMCRLEDTTYIPPDDGPWWGSFVGDYVWTRTYDGWQYFRDLFRLENIPPLPGAITRLTLLLRCGKLYVYGRAIFSMKTHGTIYDTDWYSIAGGEPVWRSFEYTTNPFTGLAWTREEVNQLQVGVNLAHAGTFGRAICDCVKVEVEFWPDG